MVMPVASGYPNYSGSLIQPILTDRILDRFACESPFLDLTTGNHLDELKRCGDTIRFNRDTPAIVRPLIKNQKLEDDFLETDCVYIRASKGLYYSLKIDEIDMHQICNSNELVDRYINNAMQQFRYGMEIDVFAEMISNVDLANQGGCAGLQTQCYDLGSEGKPRCVNADNILDWICDLHSVLAEACVLSLGNGHNLIGAGDMGGEPFLVLPGEAHSILKKALVSEGCCGWDDTNPMISGRIPARFQGFHIFFSFNVPFTKEDGTRTYYLPAGRRDATGFAVTMQDDRMMSEACHFGRRYQGYMVWAAGVLYPEALALSRVKFEK